MRSAFDTFSACYSHLTLPKLNPSFYWVYFSLPMDRVLGQFEDVREVATATPEARAWRGRDLLSGREALIKRLPASGGYKTRATQSLALSHSHIVPTRRWLRDGDGLYAVRDFVPGSNLRQTLVDASRRAFDHLQFLLNPILDALDYAHRFGLTHGGVTPENVLVDSEGNSLLCDFATIENPSPLRDAYVPRELLAANGQATARTDFYALCELYKEFLPERSVEDEAGAAARQRLLRNLSETQQAATDAEELRYKLEAVGKMAELLGFSGEQGEGGKVWRPAHLVCSVAPAIATLAPGGGTNVTLSLTNEGDQDLHVESITTDVVWLNLPTRLAPFDLPPDSRRNLVWIVSGARLQAGSYNATLTVRSNSDMSAAESLDKTRWSEQAIAVPTIVRGAAEANALDDAASSEIRPLAEELPLPDMASSKYASDSEHPGIAVMQEPDPGLARSGQNGVLHLAVKNIGSRRLRVDSVTPFPSWLVYPGIFSALWIEPGDTQYLGFSIVTATLPGGDYKAAVTFVTTVLTETLLGLQPERRQMKCDVRIRVVRGIAAQADLGKVAGGGCAPAVLAMISGASLLGYWLIAMR